MSRLFLGILILLVALMAYLISATFSENQSLKVLDQLATYTLNGQIKDVDGTVGVDDYHDIFYEYDNKGNMTLYFGNVEIKLSEEQLKDPIILDKMEKIGLTLKGSKLYYLGDEIEQ